LIGFVEEVYFRGIMLQALKRKGLWTATIITALLFGAAHSTNILGGTSPIYTLLQVGYAVPIGLSFAALALTTKLIWPLVLGHGLINFGAYLNTAAGGAISTTVTQVDYVLTAVMLVTFTIYAVILLQKGRAASFLRAASHV
jgi:membrane protease YdiL (CAAX protease family)